MNIKRGLKRIWIVGSVLVVVLVTGLTIQEFPEKPVYLYEGKNISKERLKKMKRLEYLSKKKHGKDYDYNKEKKKKYEKKRKVFTIINTHCSCPCDFFTLSTMALATLV